MNPKVQAGSTHTPRLSAPLALALAVLAELSAAQIAQPPAQAQAPRLPPEEVIVKLEQRNAQRQDALRSYLSRRRYSAANPRLHRQGYAVVELQYQSPATKTWRVVESGGSRSIRTRVFDPILKAEAQNSTPEGRAATDLTRQNFSFTFVQFDEPARAYVFDVDPRTNNKYLFRGRVWINAQEFAVQRMEGEPAQRPSFWVKKTHFVREYGKFGDFWFPVRHRTQVELRLLGASTMDIDYFDYQWVPQPAGSPAMSDPPSPGTVPGAAELKKK